MLHILAMCCFSMAASTRAFYTADEVVSMFERDGFSCLDTSESSSSGDEVLDLSDPEAFELCHNVDKLNLKGTEAIEDLSQDLDEAMMSDSLELDKISSNEELNEVTVSDQSNSEESQSSENEGDSLSDTDDR